MKKLRLFICMIGLATCMSAMAEINPVKTLSGGWPYFIPEAITLNNKPTLYAESSDSNETHSFTVIDEELNEIAKFTVTGVIGSITPYYSSGVYPLHFELSQTLFNNDADYEWIVPTGDLQNLKSTGFRIESQNGSTVATVDYPSGLYGDESFNLFIMGNKKYLMIALHNDNRDEFYMYYEIVADKGEIKAVGAPRKVSVSPTAPRRGTDVNIALDTPAEAGCKIIVTSASGKTVLVRNINTGETDTTIDTSRFEEGLYIVTVANGATITENTKIIVR